MLAIELYRFDVIHETLDVLTNIYTEGRRRFTKVSEYSFIFVKKAVHSHGHEVSMPPISGLLSRKLERGFVEVDTGD